MGVRRRSATVGALLAVSLVGWVPAGAAEPLVPPVTGSAEVTAPSSAAGPVRGQYGTAYPGYDTLDLTAPVRRPTDPGNLDGCTPFSAADAAAVAGQLVWLEWDDNSATRRCDSAARSANATAAGARGVLLTSGIEDCAAPVAGDTAIPLFQLNGSATAALRPALAAGTLTVRLAGALRAPAPTPCAVANTITAVSGDGQSTAAGTDFPAPLVVAVRDGARDVPIPGAEVTFVVAEGSASFAGGADTATVTTGADGRATSPLVRAGTGTGPVVLGAVTPLDGGREGEVIFRAAVTAAPPAGPPRADLAVRVDAPDTARPGTRFPVTLTVTNNGPSPATTVLSGVTVADELRIVAAPGGAVTSGGRAAGYRETTLAPGQTVTRALTVEASRATGSRTIAAGTASSVRDPQLRDNAALDTVRVR